MPQSGIPLMGYERKHTLALKMIPFPRSKPADNPNVVLRRPPLCVKLSAQARCESARVCIPLHADLRPDSESIWFSALYSALYSAINESYFGVQSRRLLPKEP